MKGVPRFIEIKSHAPALFRAGMPIYMLDFEQDDQRNVCRKVTSEEMLTADKLNSDRVRIVMMEEQT